MEESPYDVIRRMPRHDLEAFTIRVVQHVRNRQRERDSGRVFGAVMAGFMLGASVAAAGFLVGASLG